MKIENRTHYLPFIAKKNISHVDVHVLYSVVTRYLHKGDEVVEYGKG
jgi:hypothetical protein